jgi:hypothetical protein
MGILFQITKSLWVCEGCHISTKFITKIVGRTIMVRDVNRFHHFEDGVVGYCVSCQLLHQVHFSFNMSIGIITLP